VFKAEQYGLLLVPRGLQHSASFHHAGLQLALNWFQARKFPLGGLISRVPASEPQAAHYVLPVGKIKQPFVVLGQSW
jgi:hypothetical protein